MNTQQNTVRRVVTGHDADGKAIIVSDAPPVISTLASGELFFLVGGYCLIATILNGFDIPAPSCER
ncbi:hypothetical protein [Dyadobacter sp. OTU695]|uniref:hypothetical protein n=1 Tax=Dyadobacter sp. OTU695 TaxID=3043860 RepID=UPI00313CB69E